MAGWLDGESEAREESKALTSIAFDDNAALFFSPPPLALLTLTVLIFFSFVSLLRSEPLSSALLPSFARLSSDMARREVASLASR